MNKYIKAFRKRRAQRLKARYDAGEWNENDHPRDKDGKFASGSGDGGSANSEKQVKHKAEAASGSGSGFSKSHAGVFVRCLKDAAKSLPIDQGPWRVTQYADAAEFKAAHPGAKMHVTPGKSTVAVTPDGDIVGVCHHMNDKQKGKDLLKMAVENGGKKLDAYAGLYGFYTKCGFEPVSWCKWDEQYAPEGWVKGRDKAEHIIFYKYTGKTSQYEKAKDFFAAVPASADYDEAQITRDKSVR